MKATLREVLYAFKTFSSEPYYFFELSRELSSSLAFSKQLQTFSNGFPCLRTLWLSDLAILGDVWPLCQVMMDSFWDMVDEMPQGALISFESIDKEDHHLTKLYWWSPWGIEVSVNLAPSVNHEASRSPRVFYISMELRESKVRAHMGRVHTLEDVARLTMLLMFRDRKAVGLVLEGDDEAKTLSHLHDEWTSHQRQGTIFLFQQYKSPHMISLHAEAHNIFGLNLEALGVTIMSLNWRSHRVTPLAMAGWDISTWKDMITWLVWESELKANGEDFEWQIWV